MKALIGFVGAAALLVLAIGVSDAEAGYWRRGRYYYYPNEVRQAAPAAAVPRAAAAPRATAAPAQGTRRTYSYAPSYTPWPYYPNYGYSTGAAYSAAAGMRPGQVYGTFGLRPADARARGNY
jgi:hypothetical protein